MTGHTKGLLSVETFVSLDQAHDERCFQWATGWPHESRPACVWLRVGETGTTGLPGSIETTEVNAKRLAACWNAMQGIDDPAAYVAAFEGMREALEVIAEPINTADCIGDPWAFYRDLQVVALSALTAARAAMGEASDV